MDGVAKFGALDYGILFVYLSGLLSIGFVFSRRQKTTEDYFLAGRKMPWIIVAMSMFASLTSATTYIGVPGIAFSENIALLVQGCASIVAAPFIVLIFYPFYRKLNVTTSYEYVFRRYGAGARYVVSGLFLLARLGWLGVVIYAPALALSVVTGMNVYFAILLMGILAISYTVLGGLSAVLWADVVQFIVLTGGAVWVAISLIGNVDGGVGGIIETVRAADPAHLEIIDFNLKNLSLFKMSGVVVGISLFFQMMQDYGTDQVTVQRLMAIKDFKGMARAAITNSFFDFTIVGLLLFIGLGLFAYYTINPNMLAEGVKNDQMFPYYIMQALPRGISGIIITGVFAAAMSSMDSGINSLATVVTNDFVRPLRKTQRTEKQDVRLARILTFVIGSLAVLAGLYATTIGDVLKAAMSFIGLFGGPILALFLLGMFSRKSCFKGWIVGTLIAIPATIFIQKAEFSGQSIHFIYYFPFCFGTTFIFSFITSCIISKTKAPAELTVWGRGKLSEMNLDSKKEN
ncbi:sodium/solute symporter [Planctomycetota bacterium]